jgi:hypothetical protein
MSQEPTATERPILFTGPMVRALLDGRKTQTRRAVKPRGRCSLFDVEPDGSPVWTDSYILDPGNAEWRMRDNRYGVPGDLLWVRENVRAEELSRPPQTRPATRRERQAMGRTTVIELDELDCADGVRYLADDEWRRIENTAAAGEAWSALHHYDPKRRQPGSVVPAIHMPRWASRISLRITDVRVERLREISHRDACAEGLISEPHHWHDPEGPMNDVGYLPWQGAPDIYSEAPDAYRALWESINGPGSWAANPWVWAVSFEVVK